MRFVVPADTVRLPVPHRTSRLSCPPASLPRQAFPASLAMAQMVLAKDHAKVKWCWGFSTPAPVPPTCGSDCRGFLLMSANRRDNPNPPSFMRPFSSRRMLEGLRSQYMISLLCRNCSAVTRSRAKSCTELSGRRTSCLSRDMRSPPTQYSRMSHRWLVVSYLEGQRRVLAAARAPRPHATWRSVSRTLILPGVELEDVLMIQGVHGPHL